MRILLTGAAGFLGCHLCNWLLAEGHEVIGVDNFLTGDPDNLSDLAGKDKFEFIERDVTEPFSVPGRLDAVMHFASPASPNPKSHYSYPNLPIETLRVGSLGTLHMLELAGANQARFLFASTSEVYGDPLEHPQTEDYWGHVDPVGLRSMYDEAKRFSEAAIMTYFRSKNADTRIVRIFNTYGSHMRLDDGRVVPNFIQQALQHAPLTIYGDGSQTRSFCYVDDLVDGIYRLLLSEVHLPVNLGNPNEISILDFAKIINRLTGNQAGLDFQPSQRLGSDPERRRPDITRARSLLGWEPKVDLEEGLNRTIAYFKTKIGGK